MAIAGRAQAPLPIPGWLPVVLLLGATAAIGPSLGLLGRLAFILGCGGVGWLAWRRDPTLHLQVVLVLFAFAPFLRRLVDLATGYDPSGVMLAGPLLAILVAVMELLGPADDRPQARPLNILLPVVIVGACILYAAMLSLFQGDFSLAISNGLKWVAPLVYAAALVRSRPSSEAFLSAAASAFLIILPVMGIYGVIQYVDPPAWDRYWMNYASIMSAGEPVPFGVRTYSTMNGPASFATFTAAGLILIALLRRGWLPLLCALSVAPALLLSSYRTAWISLVVGILFCCLFRSTRPRALAALVGGLLAVIVVVTLTPFGTSITDRLASFSGGAQDSSAAERLGEYATVWAQWDSGLIGSGFTITDVGSAGAMPIDGTIMSLWVSMGIVVGLVCLVALVWAIFNATAVAFRTGSAEAVAVGALACGAFTQIPLSSITAAELGFLFWTFAVLLPSATTPGTSGLPMLQKDDR